MTTAVIGTGGIGSVIARELASGGETLRLASADNESARTLAAEIGRAAVVAVDNDDALRGADAVVLALRFAVLKGVIDEIADALAGKLVVVPSNPVGIDAQGNVSRLLPKGQSSGEVVAGWLPAGGRLAMAFGTMSADLSESSSHRSPEPAVLFYVTDDDRAGEEVERLIRTAGFEPVKVGGIEQSGRLEVGGDLHDLVVGPAEARSLIGAGRGSLSWSRHAAACHQPRVSTRMERERKNARHALPRFGASHRPAPCGNRLPAHPVRGSLACRGANPEVQACHRPNDRRRYRACARGRTSHHRHALGSFWLVAGWSVKMTPPARRRSTYPSAATSAAVIDRKPASTPNLTSADPSAGLGRCPRM